MRKYLFVILLLIVFIKPAAAMEKADSNVMFNFALNFGTFSAGENYGGSAFLGFSLSADWLPDRKTGLSYGIESVLLGGKKFNDTIYGIPICFRFGWHPDLFKNENIGVFVLAKLGWAFGLWGSNLDSASTPSAIVAGINFGGTYAFSSGISAYSEIGYNFYGLARNSDYPEYPLGYGSGKTYTSVGLSFK